MLAGERGTATLVAVLTSQSLFFGAMDVLFVVLAISELGIGDSESACSTPPSAPAV